MKQNKPFAESCEQNKDAILAILKDEFAGCHSIFEIGSGTGQHAVYFAEQMPWLNWQTSEVSQHHAGIQAWLDGSQCKNISAPIELDVTQPDHWPKQHYDGIFSANTAHIMSWSAVKAMFNSLPGIMKPGTIFCLYGPFNYDGQFTSESNARFDMWLKSQSPEHGIRDFEALNKLAEQADLRLKADHEMPANNRILVWQQKSGA